MKPLFPNWDYQQSWGELEAEQVVDRVEAYHKEVPFMLNQLRLIPDSVILNTPQGAKFQRPKSACNFVNRLLRMAGLVIERKQFRTGETDPETGKGKRTRNYSISPESLALMNGYAQSRATHKQIALSLNGADSIKRTHRVTACHHGLKGRDSEMTPVRTESRKSTTAEYPVILTNPSGNMGKSLINSDYSPKIT